MVTKISNSCLDIVKRFEGLRLNAYVDPGTGGEPITIGYGTTRYPNGLKVKLGDKITQAQADAYLFNDVSKAAVAVRSVFPSINFEQSQFDALVSFTYNVGINALASSTLARLVKQNRDNPAIKSEFMKWVNAGGKRLNGLVTRRTLEAELYFSQKKK